MKFFTQLFVLNLVSFIVAYDTLLEEFTKSLTTLSHSSQVFELAKEYEEVMINN